MGASDDHLRALSDDDWIRAVIRDGQALGFEADFLRRRAASFVRQQLERRVDHEFAERFAHHCPVAGARTTDYLHRVVTFGSDAALVGIRFRGGDMAYPFVDLLVCTSPWREVLEEFESVVRDAFAVFAPKALRVFEARVAAIEEGEVVDQWFHAATIDEVARTEDDGRCEMVRIEPVVAKDLDACFESLCRWYHDFATSEPALADRVQPTSREQLGACMADDALRWLVARDERVGLLGFARAEERYFDGFVVMEEIVARAHRGHGYAARAQHLLAKDFVPQESGTLLWGTIDAHNRASIRTARRAGRPARAAWLFHAL